MKSRTTVGLAIAAVVLVGAALWYSDARRPQQQASLQQAAVPGLSERLGDIDQVVITGAGNVVLATLRRGDDTWILQERDFPAETATLRNLLLNLSEARRVEAKTANPELYDRLGVEDVSAADAGGVLLTLSGGGEPLSLVVGQNVSRGKGTYIRPAGEAQSWQLDRNIAVEKSTANWLAKDLVDIASSRIESVDIRYGKDQVAITNSAADRAGFALANLPPGREAASEFVADATAGLLQGLRLDDVAAATEREPGDEPVREALFTTREGLQVSLRSWQDDGRTWASITATVDEQRALAHVEAEQAKVRSEWEASQAAAAGADGDAVADAAAAEDGETDGSSDTASTATSSPEGVAAEAPLAVRDPDADRDLQLQVLRDEQATLAARFEGRVFALPAFKAGNLNRELEAYLKPKE